MNSILKKVIFSIRLLPDKLANSKKFKKKYPIEIRPNGLVKTGFNVVLPTYKCPEVNQCFISLFVSMFISYFYYGAVNFV